MIVAGFGEGLVDEPHVSCVMCAGVSTGGEEPGDALCFTWLNMRLGGRKKEREIMLENVSF